MTAANPVAGWVFVPVGTGWEVCVSAPGEAVQTGFYRVIGWYVRPDSPPRVVWWEWDKPADEESTGTRAFLTDEHAAPDEDDIKEWRRDIGHLPPRVAEVTT